MAAFPGLKLSRSLLPRRQIDYSVDHAEESDAQYGTDQPMEAGLSVTLVPLSEHLPPLQFHGHSIAAGP